ncbi:MAG: putative glycoside hydrolase, partial [Acidimicrobiia bacterium]|nr:putative glycoside hydrolase [Acidimicrobiia bacterium]
LYDLDEAVETLHGLGVRVVGRIVNFRDPRLADWAVENGRMDMVVQNPDGTALGKYGGFTNPYNAEVREYNIALAEEAARAGVDDIMYDYVRRPDENIDLMRFPGQDRTPEDAIVDFLADSKQRVNGSGARLAAAVFGVAATRPDEIAQDIPRMAEHVDYIAPMLYPSHWGPGEYGVSDPNSQPYDIIYRSLVDFREKMAGTDADLVAWLQDFSLGVDYGESEVRAQIQASIDAGVPAFLLWDAATTYTTSALDPQ